MLCLATIDGMYKYVLYKAHVIIQRQAKESYIFTSLSLSLPLLANCAVKSVSSAANDDDDDAFLPVS